jgi:hypothetical protein
MCAAFLLWLWLPSAAADIPVTIGTVVATKGNWCDEAYKPCKPVSAMYPIVLEHTKLVRAQQDAAHARDFITIRSRWGALKTFDCSQPRELGCKGPLDLSRLVPKGESENVLTALFSAAQQIFAKEPRSFDNFRQGILLTRGAGPELSDGVAELTKRGVDLTNIMGAFSAGPQRLQMCPLMSDAKPDCKPQPVDIDRSPAAPLYPGQKIHPGIYRLYRWEPGADPAVLPRYYAEVLVAASPAYERLEKHFDAVIAATKDWDATDPTAPALRRVYLYSLAHRRRPD